MEPVVPGKTRNAPEDAERFNDARRFSTPHVFHLPAELIENSGNGKVLTVAFSVLYMCLSFVPVSKAETKDKGFDHFSLWNIEDTRALVKLYENDIARIRAQWPGMMIS